MGKNKRDTADITRYVAVLNKTRLRVKKDFRELKQGDVFHIYEKNGKQVRIYDGSALIALKDPEPFADTMTVTCDEINDYDKF